MDKGVYRATGTGHFLKSVLQLLLCRAIKIAKETEFSIWKALKIALHVPSRLGYCTLCFCFPH